MSTWPGQFTHGTQSLSSEIPRALFRELEQIIGRLVCGIIRKDPECPGQYEKRKPQLAASQCRTSGRATKLCSSRQCGTGTKTDTQVNGTEETNPEVDPQLYRQDRTFDEARKTIHWKKHSLFSKGCWARWTATHRGMKLDHSLTPPYTKRNSKWMKDLNVRQDSIKLLGENTGNALLELGHSNFLQDTSMKARETEPKWITGTSSRWGASTQQKKRSTKLKDKPPEWKKICANDPSDKGPVIQDL